MGNEERNTTQRSGSKGGNSLGGKSFGKRTGGGRPGGDKSRSFGGNRGGGKSFGGGKPAWKKRDGEEGTSRNGEGAGRSYKKSYGEKKSFGDKPQGKSWSKDSKRPEGKSWKKDGDRSEGKSWKKDGDRKFDDRRNDRGDRKFGERSEGKSFGKKPYGDRGDRKFDDRRNDRGDRKFGERGDGRSFGKKPYGDRGDRKFDDRRNDRGNRKFDDRRGGKPGFKRDDDFKRRNDADGQDAFLTDNVAENEEQAVAVASEEKVFRNSDPRKRDADGNETRPREKRGDRFLKSTWTLRSKKERDAAELAREDDFIYSGDHALSRKAREGIFLEVGERVVHKNYGVGTVKRVTGGKVAVEIDDKFRWFAFPSCVLDGMLWREGEEPMVPAPKTVQPAVNQENAGEVVFDAVTIDVTDAIDNAFFGSDDAAQAEEEAFSPQEVSEPSEEAETLE